MSETEALDDAALGLELDRSLAEEPRLVTDARFLGALHVELTERLGAVEASTALLQLGFVHGLRDAAQGLYRAGLFGNRGAPASTRIPMRFVTRSSGSAPQPLEIQGGWPEELEAGAVVARSGASREPCCFASAGYTSGWLSGLFDLDILAVETSCVAHGDGACRFLAREAECWRISRDPLASRLLPHLPFRALREAIASALRDRRHGEPAFDPDSPAVHVWGPVMVVPFAGADETMRAVELIGQDPGARDVSVVVVDLAGTLLDEGFGAVALERVLDAIESWGAEPLLSGLSPLSERIVSQLEREHLVVHKDLEAAIAAAFQIADASRRSV